MTATDTTALATVAALGCPVGLAGQRWFDLRPMLDEREHSTPSIDQHRLLIDHALERGLLARHPTTPHLVRLVQPTH